MSPKHCLSMHPMNNWYVIVYVKLQEFIHPGWQVREHLKAIRTREEGLDELKRRRKSVAASADSAERKLNKMSPEHKNLATQTETLQRLRDEIRQLDTDIMTEEARLGDFKRTTTRTLMGLKFGGLHELSSKAMIVGDFGKQIIAVRLRQLIAVTISANSGVQEIPEEGKSCCSRTKPFF